MTNKFPLRVFELLAGGIVVMLGVLLTAKAVPQAIALNQNESSPIPKTTPELPVPHRPVPDWRGGMRGMMAQPDDHFIRMMIPHHEAAIAMADLALTRARHPQIRALAQQIRQTQTQENHQMRDWYQQWYGTTVPDWQPGMGMGMGRGRMAGRNWQEQGMGGCMRTDLGRLKTAPDFDRAFLEEMVPHHQMGVRMAEMVLARSDRPEITTLAKIMIQTQTAEIDQMQYWYQEWYPEGVAANL